jgi:(p)ppGpp synthase/HD superfamily hydrolase
MSFTTERAALRYWLLGRGWTSASEALHLAEAHHRGLRKDGRTPEIAHQIAVAHHVRTLTPLIRHPEETLCTALLHDIREDYNLTDAEIREPFGNRVADSVHVMTKTYRGVRADDADVFAAIANDACASIAKGCDRAHNLRTMVGVFTVPKMAAYCDETRTYFYPMLKAARRLFPDQELAYENIKLTLTTQVQVLEALIDASEADT